MDEEIDPYSVSSNHGMSVLATDRGLVANREVSRYGFAYILGVYTRNPINNYFPSVASPPYILTPAFNH